MTNKATHSGTCQICGREQKLPGGQLSQHGYTVDWGYFSGVCWGSKHLPFEQSIDLIASAIDSQKSTIARLRSEIADLADSTDATKVWRNTYIPTRGYFWEQVGITETIRKSDRRQSFNWSDFDGTRKSGQPGEYLYADRTLANVVKYENAKYAATLNARIRKCESYILWQKDRINNWKPQPLEAIL